MIVDADCDFHPPAPDRMWAETNYFGFEVPQAGMHVGLYSLFRPNLDLVNSALFVNSRHVTGDWQIDFWDHRAYLPLGDTRLTDFRLENGLSVRNVEPNRVWEISVDHDPLFLDVRFEALMPPYDIHDPAMDPMARVERQDLAASDAWKGGHFDLTGALTGSLTLRGRTYEIDWFSTMDHSWGVRGEHQPGTMTWLQAHFSRDLAVHGIFSFDPTTPVGEALEIDLSHGYVMDHGDVVGLKAGRGRTERDGMHQRTMTLELVDAKDRQWTVTGVARTGFPVEYWPGSMSFMAMIEWTMDGHTGYGTSTDFFDYAHFTGLYADSSGLVGPVSAGR